MEALASYANSIEPGKWITGGDWDSYEWGCDLPDRHLIDSMTPNNPVWIGRHEGHMYLANTLALTLAGLLDKEIQDIEGGTIGRDKDCLPNGIFKDNALKFVFDAIPAWTFEDQLKNLEAAQTYVLKHGVTSIHHMTEPPVRNAGGIASDLSMYE